MTPSTATAPIYSPSEIEPRWQARWAEAGIFEAEPSAERPNWVVIELPPFANGALRAAQWVVGQKPGIYDMQDVLGLRDLRA